MDVAGRQVGRVVYFYDFAIGGQMHFVDDARRSGNQRQVELALQTLLHDVQMQQAQKAAAVAEAERRRRFRLKGQGGIV